MSNSDNHLNKSALPQKKVYALFISDLHLCDTRPHITEAFLAFLQDIAIQAESLYILGDLFEYWAGDDDVETPFHQSICHAFTALSQHTHIYFMHGNRDFLIGDLFCAQTNITLLSDPTKVTIHTHDILLSHGDALCWEDTEYQKMRLQFRNLEWQNQFLAQPLAMRKQQIANIRMQSEQEKSKKSAIIMDVNSQAVCELLTEFNYPPIFIHGHTHRPAQHQLSIEGHNITRWVLGDWYDQGSFLALDDQGFHTAKL